MWEEERDYVGCGAASQKSKISQVYGRLTQQPCRFATVSGRRVVWHQIHVNSHAFSSETDTRSKPQHRTDPPATLPEGRSRILRAGARCTDESFVTMTADTHGYRMSVYPSTIEFPTPRRDTS